MASPPNARRQPVQTCDGASLCSVLYRRLSSRCRIEHISCPDISSGEGRPIRGCAEPERKAHGCIA
eukprot:356348-Chlamydomonas_euryale.AAC.21